MLVAECEPLNVRSRTKDHQTARQSSDLCVWRLALIASGSTRTLAYYTIGGGISLSIAPLGGVALAICCHLPNANGPRTTGYRTHVAGALLALVCYRMVHTDSSLYSVLSPTVRDGSASASRPVMCWKHFRTGR
jgi:hypothetical protein